MSVKFRIGFNIASETLFAMLAKMLPIEDLEVEELGPWPITGEKLLSKSQAGRAIALHQKRFLKPKRKRVSAGPSLTRGINALIVTQLSDGPKRAVEMQQKVVAAGFSANSVTSRLEALQSHGVISRVGDGLWKLNQKNAAA